MIVIDDFTLLLLSDLNCYVNKIMLDLDTYRNVLHMVLPIATCTSLI